MRLSPTEVIKVSPNFNKQEVALMSDIVIIIKRGFRVLDSSLGKGANIEL